MAGVARWCDTPLFYLSAAAQLTDIVGGMRLLYTSLIAISVLILQYADNPSFFHRLWGTATSRSGALLQEKEVRIEGLKVLPRSEVERVLPYDKSVLWWHINGTDIQSKVEESPWIDVATLGSCPEGVVRGWGCFVITVNERTPKFIAAVDNERWIIGDDGAFIMPSGGPLYGLDANAINHLVLVEGLASRTHSPDMVRSQLALAANSIATLERVVGRSARSLRFEARGDFSVIFEGVPFPVVFTAATDAPIPLAEQGERLVSLIAKLKDRLGDVASVDLAFARVGVVKFRTDLPPPVVVEHDKKGSKAG